jgi:hypothetical protein
MLSEIVPAIRWASCGTKVTLRAHSVRESTRMSRPSASTKPVVGSRSPSSNWTSVDLPLPDGPITPMTSWGSMVASICRSTGVPVVYSNDTSSRRSAPTKPIG